MLSIIKVSTISEIATSRHFSTWIFRNCLFKCLMLSLFNVYSRKESY